MRVLALSLSLSLPLILAGCMFGGGGDRPAPSPIRERPGGPITLNGPPPPEAQQSFADLSRGPVGDSPLPDRDFGGGCVVTGAVQLLDIGVPVTGLKSMKCGLARSPRPLSARGQGGNRAAWQGGTGHARLVLPERLLRPGRQRDPGRASTTPARCVMGRDLRHRRRREQYRVL